jgi:anaerobic magnesium-protoporphyrin IX monomethyl ester cyclase
MPTQDLGMPEMSHRKKVLLFNPLAAFYDMPLALIAIGSALDASRYEPIIVDARIDPDYLQKLKLHAPDAVCFATTVITGYPIRSALDVSRAMKLAFPELPIIWGGWHPSLFPEQPLLDETCIDITVQGQGEETFRELVECLATGGELGSVAGICFRNEDKIQHTLARPLKAMESFGRLNYDLVNVEAYFEKKGRRQFDYISSTGCFFRCAFCSDPFVFGRKFTAIPGETMVEDLAYYQEKYKFTDLNFQDETFFTYAKRIEAFAAGLIEKGISFSWAATMRADQGERLGDEIWELCKRSGLRRLLIGVESGSQEMMDWLKKDIKMEQVWWCAEKCKSLGIGVHFPFIVGFPDESEASLESTVEMVKALNRMSPDFVTPIFYFKPYPGSSITDDLVKKGYRLPASTEEWASFDFHHATGPWVSAEKEKRIETLKFYLKLGYRRRHWAFRPLQSLAKWRVEGERFAFPIEKKVIGALKARNDLK